MHGEIKKYIVNLTPFDTHFMCFDSQGDCFITYSPKIAHDWEHSSNKRGSQKHKYNQFMESKCSDVCSTIIYPVGIVIKEEE